MMLEEVNKIQVETGNLYNLEATPAEGTSYRLAKIDKKMHEGIIQSGCCEPYYTNSTQLPVGISDVLFAIKHQNEIQQIYTGGTVFHTFLGESVANEEAVKDFLIKVFTNTKMPFVSITPTFSICKSHGYLIGEQKTCPNCGGETEIYTRIVGYYRPVARWNRGKQSEYEDRNEFKMSPRK